MATEGQLYTKYSARGARLKVSWETIERDEYSGTSKIKWVAELDGEAGDELALGIFVLFIGGEQVYEFEGINHLPSSSLWIFRVGSENVNMTFSATGEYTLYHNSDGDCNFDMNIICEIDTRTGAALVYEDTFSLNPFPRIATVNATSAYIGEDITVTINRKSTSDIFSYALKYEFGELSGSIANSTKDATYYWTIPTSFYAQMPNASSKAGVITCETYRNGVLEGSSTGNFNAMVEPESCKPLLSPTVIDISSDTLALTGDEDTVVRYESMIEYAFNAIALNGATIANTTITCGSQKISGMEQGVIDDVESGTFVFTVTDSRGLVSEKTITKNTINYSKPTCNQSVKINLADDGSGAEARVVISGKCFKGSFGLTDNTILVEIRHTQLDGSMGDWVDLTPLLPELSNDNTYSLEFNVTGLTYSQEYTFQSRLTDKLNYVQSAQYTTRVLPIFDWSKDEFNFNVPVNMSGETVLRYNEEAGNVVLSAEGNIYLRPGGTNRTGAETIFFTDGTVKFGGNIDMSGAMPDYIIETGSEAMGSNGTWYWEKWNSGKAVCWGSRNFGRMAVTTAFGNVFRSDVQNQELPTGLFNGTPDVININMNEATYNGWIARMAGVLASETNTGNFSYVLTSSATLSKSQIGFYVVGRWN